MNDHQSMGDFAEIEARLRRDLAEIADRIGPPIGDGANDRARQGPVISNELGQRSYVSPSHSETRVTSHRQVGRPVLVAAAAAVTLVLTGGILLLARDADPDRIQTVPPTTGPTPTTAPAVVAPSTVPKASTTTVAPSADEGESEAGAIALPSIAATRVEGEPTAVAGTELSDAVGGGDSSLGPWDDGFLLVNVSGGLQMVEELSDDMFARFPAAVRAAYPDQLQGPLHLVIAQFEADGLLDEVGAVLEADPELEAAVMGGPTTPVELRAEFSLDGESWTPVEIMAPPDIVPEYVAVMDGRVVLLGTPPMDVISETMNGFRPMVVASTVNLAEWSLQTMPDAVRALFEVSVVANDGGWVAHIEPDTCTQDDRIAGTCGWPVDGPPLTWAASWGGEPVPVQGMQGSEGVRFVALQSGFLAQAPSLQPSQRSTQFPAVNTPEFSPDGVTWAPVPDAPVGFVQGAFPLDDGSSVVVMWTSPCGPPFFHVDETGQIWEAIDLDVAGIPTGLLSGPGPRRTGGFPQMPRTSAALFDETGPTIETTRLEQSGLQLMMRSCPEELGKEVWYELTDAQSGEVLVSESGWWRPLGGAFEYLTLDEDELTIRDPATAENLFVAEIDGDPFDTDGAEGTWLLATTDGTEWLINRVPGSSSGASHRHLRVARNSDTVLVQIDQTWLRYDLPRG